MFPTQMGTFQIANQSVGEYTTARVNHDAVLQTNRAAVWLNSLIAGESGNGDIVNISVINDSQLLFEFDDDVETKEEIAASLKRYFAHLDEATASLDEDTLESFRTGANAVRNAMADCHSDDSFAYYNDIKGAV